MSVRSHIIINDDITCVTTSTTLFPYTTLFRSDRRTERRQGGGRNVLCGRQPPQETDRCPPRRPRRHAKDRSEEHTSELQSHSDIVCRLLLEKKKKFNTIIIADYCIVIGR